MTKLATGRCSAWAAFGIHIIPLPMQFNYAPVLPEACSPLVPIRNTLLCANTTDCSLVPSGVLLLACIGLGPNFNALLVDELFIQRFPFSLGVLSHLLYTKKKIQLREVRLC